MDSPRDAAADAADAADRPDHAGLLAAAEAELAAINDALHRLDDDSYGRCTGCGAPIPDHLLEADPLVVTCVGCAAVAGPASTGVAPVVSPHG